ncbi:energy transducer TonB [Arenimonas sp. MALMAid1274]|uniref:energy transducer TonB n=1 Tax=Arenimonas sp. MALMAid1274 TaxID=3411630 RepID=UPI003BA2AB57
MKLLALLAVSVSLASTVQAVPERDCEPLDPSLVHCPTPEAPRVTGLAEGSVLIRLTVQPDGSVSGATVLSSSGHAAWKEAALEVVRRWRYKATDESSTRDAPFKFSLGGELPPN